MTSVKQNNDTALKSTGSRTVIGEGLIQSLQELNQPIKYSFRPESKSMNDTIRSAQSEICLEKSEGRKKQQEPESPLPLNKEIAGKVLLQSLAAESLDFNASPAFEKY